MMGSIFNIDNYFFNIHSVAFFITGIFILAESVFIFLQNKKSMLNFSFSVSTLCATLWLTGIGLMYSSRFEAIAFIWNQYYAWLGIIFVTPAVYFFSTVWEGVFNRRKKIIYFNFATAGILYLICISSNYLVKGVWLSPWGYYPNAGIGEILYLVWFYTLMTLSFVNFIRTYKKETMLIKKRQTKFIIVAFVFGFLGSLDYIADFHIPLYPIGGIVVIFFTTTIAYTIINYKLMDIETVIHKTLIWLVASSIIFVPIVLLSYWLHPWYKEATPLKVAFLCGVIFFFLTLYLKLIQPKIDHFFQRRKYDLEKASERFVSELVHLKTPDELIKKIEQTISDTLYAGKTSIQITNLSTEGTFLNWLSKNDSIVYKDFIETDPKYESVRNNARQYFEKLDAVVIIPLVMDKKVLGVISLGKKSNLKRYNAYDFQFLLRLKNESTIALSNSLLYGRVEEEVKIRTGELVQTQRQLIQAEKLATVGTLAGGVAHEINNPLAAVLTNAQMLLMEAKADDEKESLQLIEQAAKRCREIVQKLMVYSRRPLGGREIKELDLEDALNNVLSFLGYQLNQDNIKITTNLQNPPFILKGNQGELEQVFANLILNAKDAIKHAKKSGNIDISLARQDDKIIIKLKDDGIGIPKEHISKIFDPFFTTKDVGKGTGLGLSICQSIIEQHNGTIAVESQKGGGSTFTIILPSSLAGAKIESSNLYEFFR